MKILFQLAATFFSYYTYNFEKAKNEKKSIFLYYLAKQGSFFSQLVPSALAIACPFQKIVHSYLLYRLSLKKFRRSIECKLGVFCPNFVGPTGTFFRCWLTRQFGGRFQIINVVESLSLEERGRKKLTKGI